MYRASKSARWRSWRKRSAGERLAGRLEAAESGRGISDF